MADPPSKPNPPKNSPGSAPHPPAHSGTPRFVPIATICAATLSSAASIIAITSFLKRPDPSAQIQAASPPAAPSPATAVGAPAPLAARGGGGARGERLKEIWNELTPDQRDQWKRMGSDERKEFLVKFERDRRAAPIQPTTPAQ